MGRKSRITLFASQSAACRRKVESVIPSDFAMSCNSNFLRLEILMLMLIVSVTSSSGRKAQAGSLGGRPASLKFRYA